MRLHNAHPPKAWKCCHLLSSHVVAQCQLMGCLNQKAIVQASEKHLTLRPSWCICPEVMPIRLLPTVTWVSKCKIQSRYAAAVGLSGYQGEAAKSWHLPSCLDDQCHDTLHSPGGHTWHWCQNHWLIIINATLHIAMSNRKVKPTKPT